MVAKDQSDGEKPAGDQPRRGQRNLARDEFASANAVLGWLHKFKPQPRRGGAKMGARELLGGNVSQIFYQKG